MAPPGKRRKVYLDRGEYFDVPWSTRDRHEKAHAKATASTTHATTAGTVTHAVHSGNAASPDASEQTNRNGDAVSRDVSTDDDGSDNSQKQLNFLIDQTKEDLYNNLSALQQPSTTIDDITRAQCYSRFRAEQNLGPDDLTLTINTDGSPVWKSSKTSVWPLQFIVNDLPPQVRFKHPILAGLWFGNTHPQMQLFLQKFVEEVNSTDALQWAHKGSIHESKPYVLCVSVDAPARAAVQNMVTFNGYFGCTWCLIRGEHREGE
ncbi:hypothetical protein HPB50_015134 [Hyalomma asiaticum]|uniref:Uncharacterized protein n=1 Tax=Hyalomma asiaticum TaxID=266040 RepID=A0ACB7RVA8_HYAAI|nr:hypothetical protein HPB50_015134 [Hyalomma asiaticum]